RGRHPLQRDVLEQDFHVLERVDGHSHLAHLAVGHRIVRVVTDLRRQVKGDREACLALLQKEAVTLVGLGGGAEAGVLAHGPEAGAVHLLVDAARERKRSRHRFVARAIVHRVDGLEGEATVVLELTHASTNSVSTPPTLLGWTNAMRVPWSPMRGS